MDLSGYNPDPSKHEYQSQFSWGDDVFGIRFLKRRAPILG
jgi:hypothetical protein